MTTEEIYAIAPNKDGWRVLPSGDWVTLGNGVTLGDEVKLGNGVKLGKTPIQVQCSPYIVYPHSPTQIGVGCVIHDIEYWQRDADPDELADHPECQPWATYRQALALVIAHNPWLVMVFRR